MSEKSRLISEENQPTVIAASITLGLLALVIGFYDYTLIGRVVAATAHMNNINVENIETNLVAHDAAIGAMSKKMAEMEAKMAAMAPPAAPPTAPPADAVVNTTTN